MLTMLHQLLCGWVTEAYFENDYLQELFAI